MSLMLWLQLHRRSILALLLLLALGGLLAAFRLPVTLFPNVDFPRVQLSLDAGDRPAEQMALEVTAPVEQVIRRVPGVRSIRSTSSRGSADISVNFDWGMDMTATTLQVNAAVAQILPDLPPGTSLETRRMDPTVFPVLAYSLTSATRSQIALHDIAQYQLLPLLSSIEGVAKVQVQGGAEEEYRVEVDPARLQAMDLGLDDISQALAAANVISAAGHVQDQGKLYLVIGSNRLHSPEDVGNVVLRSYVDGLLRLHDVARVRALPAPNWQRINADGQPAVLVEINQQPGSNSVAIAAAVTARLAELRKTLPPDVHIANWYDQSQLVVAAAASVRDAILIGAFLAAAVLLLFLRNLKVTLIALLVVPLVLASTIVLLRQFNMSFNIMTLGGMAAAVGLIIDDAIVMVEHIMRRLQDVDSPHARHERVLAAAAEFFRPLAGSSAATLVIFLPLAFLDGVTGAFFKALSLTMAAGLCISFLITWLAVPLLADHLLKARDLEAEHGGRLTHWFHRHYRQLMQRVLRQPLWILAGLLPLLLAGGLCYRAVGTGFMPSMDEGGFILDYHTGPGTSLTETDRVLHQAEAIIRANPNVATYSRRTGAQLGGGVTEANEGDFFIRLKPGKRQPIETVMDDLRRRILANVPGLDIEMAQLMEDLIGDLTSVPQPVEIKLFSDDPALLDKTARSVAEQLGHLPGIVDVSPGVVPAGDALEIHVDPVRASFEGVDADSVTRQVTAAMAGTSATRIAQSPKTIDVRVTLQGSEQSTVAALAQLPIRASDGHLLPLDRVASVVPVSGQPQINRENLQRMAGVTARISGRDLGSVMADVKKMMQRPGELPATMHYELGGLYEQQQIAFHGLLAVLAAAVALVFLLLMFLYERARVALVILAMPLLALAAVFIGLWLTGIELNISAMMGMTMIVGIVTEVAIFYFSEYEDCVKEMGHDAALLEAGIKRMRPIAMTTLAAILTLLPLAFALGQGSAMQQPLAVAIIAGLLVQLPLVLVVMPVLFHWSLGAVDNS
jgi:CzcA family heavy metal efflux pump